MKKRLIALQLASIICFFLFSVSFLIMPIKNDGIVQPRWVVLLSGLMFWIPLLLGIASQILLSKLRKDYLIKDGKINNRTNRIGLLTFFSNTYALIADSLFVLSILILIVLIIFYKQVSYIHFVFIFLTVLMFSFHCIFNGKNYRFVTKTYNRYINKEQ